jgi:hypothetical protein
MYKTFYFRAAIHRKDGHLLGVQLQIEAHDLTEASRLFAYWSAGAMVFASNVTLEGVELVKPSGDWHLPNNEESRERIARFLLGS